MRHGMDALKKQTESTTNNTYDRTQHISYSFITATTVFLTWNFFLHQPTIINLNPKGGKPMRITPNVREVTIEGERERGGWGPKEGHHDGSVGDTEVRILSVKSKLVSCSQNTNSQSFRTKGANPETFLCLVYALHLLHDLVNPNSESSMTTLILCEPDDVATNILS